MPKDFVKFTEEGLDDMIDVVDKISGPPSFKTIGALEAVHAGAFAATQALVHSPANPGSPRYVPTGSLKSSGTTDVETDPKEWSASITYGGASHGFPNDPVEYAIYEKARGGEHDFFSELPSFFEAYLRAVGTHFQGSKK